MPKLGKGRFLAKVDKLYLRWFAYAMVLLVTSLFQAAPRLFPAIGGAHPTPLIPLVVCIAMFEGPFTGAAVGIGGGLLWALYADRLFGFDALLLLAVGCACGLLIQLLLRNNWLSALLLNAATLVTYVLVDWLTRFVLFADADAWFALYGILLPNALYTFLLSPIMYWLIYLVARGLREAE